MFKKFIQRIIEAENREDAMQNGRFKRTAEAGSD